MDNHSDIDNHHIHFDFELRGIDGGCGGLLQNLYQPKWIVVANAILGALSLK